MKRAPRIFKIAVIPGDGIGGEVIAEGVRVLDRVAELSGGGVSFEWAYFPWGAAMTSSRKEEARDDRGQRGHGR